MYKGRIGTLCESLDEYMLLAGDSPYQEITEDGDYYRVSFAGVQMQFLRSDTLVLPIRNATVEEFSRYLLQGLVALSAQDDIREIELCVCSGPGQQGCASWTPPQVPGP